MKKILIAVLLILIAVLIAFFVILANINRARPLLEQKLSAAFGQPVKLGHLTVGWLGGPVLGAERISVGQLALKDLSITLSAPAKGGSASGGKNFSLARPRPVDFEGSAAFSSARRNVRVSGRFEPEKESWKPARIDIHLEGDEIVFEKLKSPIETLRLQAAWNPKEARLESLTMNLAGGKVGAEAVTRDLDTTPVTQFAFSAENLALERLTRGDPGKPQLQGKIFGWFKGTSEGVSGEEFSRRLSGNGQVVLKEAALIRLNILREILGHLAKLPGMAETLQSRLSPYTQAKLAEPYTAFRTVDLPFVIKEGALYFSDLKVGTNEFLLAGQGVVTFQGSINIQSWLILNAELSYILSSGVPETAYFMDSLGQIQVPVRIEGSVDHIQFKPDTDYIAKKVAFNKGQELLSGLLSKTKKGGSGAKQLLGNLI